MRWMGIIIKVNSEQIDKKIRKNTFFVLGKKINM